MKLRNANRGMRVAIRENVIEHTLYDDPPKKVNTYDLIIQVGKGKARAMMLAHAVQKFLATAARVSR